MKKSKAELKKIRQANMAKARAARKLSGKRKAVKRVGRPKGSKSKVTKDFVVGFTNEMYKPVMVGRSYALLTVDNETTNKVAGISKAKMKKAFKDDKVLRAFVNKAGKTQWKYVDKNEFRSHTASLKSVESGNDTVSEAFETHEALKAFIHEQGVAMKPDYLYMENLKWKYLIRSAVRGKNIMMLGPTGAGKTLAAQTVVKVLARPDFYFNLGSTQDPRAALIGNTHFNKMTGTFFSESAFVKAIKTQNAIILLDELTRAHPEAWNILMSVLDYGQRYLRLDEAEGSPIVKVASGVTFIATANVGNEYTATRILDRAIRDRFVTIEMAPLSKDEEYSLLKFKFPQASDYALNALAEIADHTRTIVKSGEGKLTEQVSTRVNVEAAGLIYDGFTLQEAAEIAILPYFSNDGGLDSERVYMRQLVQKYKEVEPTPAPADSPFQTSDDNDPDAVKW